MGTETTSASYRRTQTHESQNFPTQLLESKETGSEYLTQTKQRKTLKKNLICAILNTVAQAANFDTIGGNYYVQI